MIKEAFQISYEGKAIGESGDRCPYSYSMNVTKMVATSVFALATVVSAASTVTSDHVPPWLPPLLTLPYYTVPTTDSCYDGVCKSPANGHPDQPASVRADNSLANGHPDEPASVRADTVAISPGS